MSWRQHLSKTVPCDYCKAAPGEPCRAKSGMTHSSYTHRVRGDAIDVAWNWGFRQGQQDIIYAVDSYSDWGRSYIDARRKEIDR